jgi:serine/threonine protein kinase
LKCCNGLNSNSRAGKTQVKYIDKLFGKYKKQFRNDYHLFISVRFQANHEFKIENVPYLNYNWGMLGDDAHTIQPALGRYQLLELIGRGGMSTVYKGQDLQTGGLVAIKILHPAMMSNESWVSRFRREVQVVMHLKHPNILPIIDYGEDQGAIYLVMPYMPNGSLADRLKVGALTPKEGAKLFAQISSALNFIHQNGIVHRDVKPGNILFDENGNAYLGDFGLVHIPDASISLTGSAIIGTPAYMSPEQARGKKLDASSDQYAMGIILFRLITGQLPFDAETPVGILVKHASEPLPSLTSLKPNLSKPIENVILKATAKDPTDRFESMEAFNEAFQAALAHAIDPKHNTPPNIRAPQSNKATLIIPKSRQAFEKKGRDGIPTKWLYVGGVVLLLLVFICPASVMGLANLLDRTPTPQSSLSTENYTAAELTALAATIQVMETQLAARVGDDMSAQEIKTQVFEMLVLPTSTLQPAEATLLANELILMETNAIPTLTNPTGQNPTASNPTVSGNQATATTAASNPTSSAPTNTPFSNPTSTPFSNTAATSTKTATFTTVPPTLTSTPTATNPPPTRTPTPTPTKTPPPTPTEDVCALIDVNDFATVVRNVSWKVDNNSASDMTITRLVLAWPSGNGSLEKVRAGNKTIWDAGSDTSPTSIDVSQVVDANASVVLTFSFKNKVASTGYDLDVNFAGGCRK